MALTIERVTCNGVLRRGLSGIESNQGKKKIDGSQNRIGAFVGFIPTNAESIFCTVFTGSFFCALTLKVQEGPKL